MTYAITTDQHLRSRLVLEKTEEKPQPCLSNYVLFATAYQRTSGRERMTFSSPAEEPKRNCNPTAACKSRARKAASCVHSSSILSMSRAYEITTNVFICDEIMVIPTELSVLPQMTFPHLWEPCTSSAYRTSGVSCAELPHRTSR